MMARLDALFRQHWQALGLSQPPARDELRWLIYNGGVSARSRLVCLYWIGDEVTPRFVVKFARSSQDNDTVAGEYQILTQLQRYAPLGPVCVPQPLVQDELDGLFVTVETLVLGRPLRAYLREHPGAASLLLARLQTLVEWLASLHLRSARQVEETELRQQISAPLVAACELDLSAAEVLGLATLRRLAERVTPGSLPLVFNQHDPSPTNVLVDRYGDFVGLVDWEAGGWGLPAVDLLDFLVRYLQEAQPSGGTQLARNYPALCSPVAGFASDSLLTLARAHLAEYCRLVGVAPASLPLLFGLNCIMHARNERRQLFALRDAGQVIQGPPAAVTPLAIAPDVMQQGFFRTQLRDYLCTLESVVGRSFRLGVGV